MSDATVEPAAIRVGADDGPVDDGSADDGPVDDGSADDGPVDDAPMDDAAADGAARLPDDPPPVGAPKPSGSGDLALLALVDRLAAILERSDLVELEVEAGGTGLTLRKPEAIAPVAAAVAAAAPSAAAPGTPGSVAPAGAQGAGRPSVAAPLTGIWYAAPNPGSPPFVQVGGEVASGQVIGLIEAMKLFNEIKSDRSGRVAAVLVESGQLVKARQPLIEVVPL